MKRFAATVPVLLVVLLVFTSAAEIKAAPKVARIGMLCAPSCGVAFFEELRKLGWVEGTTIIIERKEAGSRLDQLSTFAADLVRSKPDLIVTMSPQPARAAKDATSEIPIVMLFVADPVGLGLASSLARPGGNLTGVATLVPGGFGGKAPWHSSRALATSEAGGSFHQSFKRDPSAEFPTEHYLRPSRSAFNSTLSRCVKLRKFLAQLSPLKLEGGSIVHSG